MTVQDDERERELVRMFNLAWDPDHSRGGEDAHLFVTTGGHKYRLSVEVKSTTTDTVSTARDVSMDHIERWRRMFFVIGFYTKDAKRPELLRALCLTPVDMSPWIDSIAAKIEPDFKLAQLASRRLELADLFEVCGKKEAYALDDARRLHKQQWTSLEYQAAIDLPEVNGGSLTPGRMLEVLRLRAKYIANRGATLNNPHITRSHLAAFSGTTRDVDVHEAAAAVRRLAIEFITRNPEHPAVVRA